MSKTNFTKTERALEKGLQRIAMNRLLEEASVQKKSQEDPPPFSKITQELEHSFKLLQKDLKKMHEKDTEIYKTLNITKEELEQAIHHLDLMKPEEIEKIKEVITKVEEYKKIMQSNDPALSQEKIEKERIKEKRRRHNVKSNWIPL